MTSSAFPSRPFGFQVLQDFVAARVDLGASFPDWPFRDARGFATICEYDRILGGDFGDVLAELAATYGDDSVTVVGIEPRLPYYHDEYGLFPAFQIAGARIRDDYATALGFEPRGDPTGALVYSLNVLAITGSSGAWSVFGQRSWEIGLLLAPDADGPWLSAGVPWYGDDVDLDSIRSPVGWGTKLSDTNTEAFFRHLRERGSGA